MIGQSHHALMAGIFFLFSITVACAQAGEVKTVEVAIVGDSAQAVPKRSVVILQEGDISKLLRVKEWTIRGIDLSDGLNTGKLRRLAYVSQGHLVNINERKVTKIAVDLSYYDKHGNFLGLDSGRAGWQGKTGKGEAISFTVRLHIPSKTAKCVLNVGPVGSIKRPADALFDENQ